MPKIDAVIVVVVVVARQMQMQIDTDTFIAIAIDTNANANSCLTHIRWARAFDSISHTAAAENRCTHKQTHTHRHRKVGS